MDPAIRHLRDIAFVMATRIAALEALCARVLDSDMAAREEDEGNVSPLLDEIRAAIAPAPAPEGMVKSYYGEPISPTGDAPDADLYKPAPGGDFSELYDSDTSEPFGETKP